MKNDDFYRAYIIIFFISVAGDPPLHNYGTNWKGDCLKYMEHKGINSATAGRYHDISAT